MKRMFAPSHWCLDKLRGVYATRPSAGPHKLRECIPLSVLLRNRLKYALSGQEALKICRDRDNANIKIDNKIRRDHRFPVGFMDVVSIPRTGQHYRMLYDTKGRFQPHSIESKEASFKLCKVKSKTLGKNKIPYITTHEGRTIRYPHPDVKINDTIKLNLETGEIDGVIKFENGANVIVNGGNNIGRIGILQHIDHHPGSYEIAAIKDVNGKTFATRLSNVFAIGDGKKPVISLPRGKGIKLTLVEELRARQTAVEEEE